MSRKSKTWVAKTFQMWYFEKKVESKVKRTSTRIDCPLLEFIYSFWFQFEKHFKSVFNKKKPNADYFNLKLTFILFKALPFGFFSLTPLNMSFHFKALNRVQLWKNTNHTLKLVSHACEKSWPNYFTKLMNVSN